MADLDGVGSFDIGEHVKSRPDRRPNRWEHERDTPEERAIERAVDDYFKKRASGEIP